MGSGTREREQLRSTPQRLPDTDVLVRSESHKGPTEMDDPMFIRGITDTSEGKDKPQRCERLCDWQKWKAWEIDSDSQVIIPYI